MNNEIVDRFNDEARELEARLEDLGKMICDVPKSGVVWQHINRAIGELQRAIYRSHVMYED